MNKKILFAGMFVLLIGTIGFFAIDNKEKNSFSCDNLGIIYLTPSEAEQSQGLKDRGIIIRIPETDSYIMNTEVLKCPNIDQYLGHLKQ